MFEIIGGSAKLLVQFLEKQTKLDDVVDLRIGVEKVTIDVIAKLIFGYDPQTFSQEEPSMFEQQCRNMDFASANPFKLMFIFFFPKLAGWLGFTFFRPEVQAYFGQTVKREIKRREDSNERAPDMLQFFIASTDKATHAKVFGVDETVALGLMFMMAGSQPTQSALASVIHQLAINPEIQEKLSGEVERIWIQANGQFRYEDVNYLEYLDNVVIGEPGLY
jgi:cytochrome P450